MDLAFVISCMSFCRELLDEVSDELEDDEVIEAKLPVLLLYTNDSLTIGIFKLARLLTMQLLLFKRSPILLLDLS